MCRIRFSWQYTSKESSINVFVCIFVFWWWLYLKMNVDKTLSRYQENKTIQRRIKVPDINESGTYCMYCIHTLSRHSWIHYMDCKCNLARLDCHVITTEYRTRVHCIHMHHLFWNALVHEIYSWVSGQYSHTIHMLTYANSIPSRDSVSCI